ncbi:MAG: DUF2723 domain-containing protein [Chloroflexi bacterium]|nr:DUF2723 domain-containing protein [Chloroflexota bacterium]
MQSEAVAGESFVLAEMPPDEFTPDPYPFAKVGVAAWDHPLYIVAGHMLVRALPFVDPLWLINLISAIFGAASVTLLFLFIYRYTESMFASWYASLSLAVSHTFWWHSSTPEVYTLFVFLLLLSLYFFEKFESAGKQKYLIFSAFVLGLAASTHILAFLAFPAIGLYYLFSRKYRDFHISQSKQLILPALGFLFGFSLYLVQFVRMSSNFPLDKIMGPVVGSTFLTQLDALSPLLLGQSLLSYLFFLMVQFGIQGIILGILGIRKILNGKNIFSRKINFSFLVFFLFGIFYRVTDQFTFFITSYVFWAILMGIGAGYALSLFLPNRRLLLPVILSLLLAATPFFYTALPQLAASNGLDDTVIGIPKIGVGVRDGLAYYVNPNKRGDASAYDFGSRVLENLEPNSVIIAEWYTDTDEYFIFRYFTKIEKLRPDVTVVGWAMQDPFYFDSQLALDVVNEYFRERPVYLASLSDRFYAASKLIEIYCIIPENNLYRLYPRKNGDSRCLGSDSVTE